MKSIKMLGLAAFAVVMAMAFVGASSAMATNTQLCKADENPCAVGNVITHVHEETLTGARAKVLTSLGTVECDVLFLGDSLGLGAPLVIHGHFTYSGCKLNKTEPCTAGEISTDSLASVLKTGHETAEVTYTYEINVNCNFLFFNCTYGAVGLKATAKGPLLSSFANGDVTISDQILTPVAALCPKVSKLDISTMPLEPTYISS